MFDSVLCNLIFCQLNGIFLLISFSLISRVIFFGNNLRMNNLKKEWTVTWYYLNAFFFSSSLFINDYFNRTFEGGVFPFFVLSDIRRNWWNSITYLLHWLVTLPKKIKSPENFGLMPLPLLLLVYSQVDGSNQSCTS